MKAMAPDDDRKRQLERRQREDEIDEEIKASQRATSKEKLERAPTSVGDSDQLRGLLDQTELLIEQVSNLYGQYFAGLERLPPVEKRRLLERQVATIQASGTSIPALKFRVSSVLAKFQTQKDRWDRTMKDLEAGKIKRGGKG